MTDRDDRRHKHRQAQSRHRDRLKQNKIPTTKDIAAALLESVRVEVARGRGTDNQVVNIGSDDGAVRRIIGGAMVVLIDKGFDPHQASHRVMRAVRFHRNLSEIESSKESSEGLKEANPAIG